VKYLVNQYFRRVVRTFVKSRDPIRAMLIKFNADNIITRLSTTSRCTSRRGIRLIKICVPLMERRSIIMQRVSHQVTPF